MAEQKRGLLNRIKQHGVRARDLEEDSVGGVLKLADKVESDEDSRPSEITADMIRKYMSEVSFGIVVDKKTPDRTTGARRAAQMFVGCTRKDEETVEISLVLTDDSEVSEENQTEVWRKLVEMCQSKGIRRAAVPMKYQDNEMTLQFNKEGYRLIESKDFLVFEKPAEQEEG